VELGHSRFVGFLGDFAFKAPQRPVQLVDTANIEPSEKTGRVPNHWNQRRDAGMTKNTMRLSSEASQNEV